MIKLSHFTWAFCASFLLCSISASADGFDVIKKNKCESCHDFTGTLGVNKSGLWRKGPALYYAGSKYQDGWVEEWLQNPERIRPAGAFYLDHVQTGRKYNVIRKETLKDHIKLNAKDAKDVAILLADLTAKNSLIKAEHYDPTMKAGPLGEMMFNKIYGCLACHSIEPNYGGLSGPELYTAGQRLKPEYMLSIIRDPQAWNHKTWMPTRKINEEDMQKLVNYIISLSDNNTSTKPHALESTARNYRVYCMQCHGIAGSGSGVNSRDMAVPPRNHTDGKYLEARTDDELFQVIKYGGLSINKSALMPPWGGTMTDTEIRNMVKHVRKLCDCKYTGPKTN